MSMNKLFKNKLIFFLLLVLITRVIYTFIGVYSRQVNLQNNQVKGGWTYNSPYQAINIWTNWDSGDLFKISTNGYPKNLLAKSNTYHLIIPQNQYIIVYTPSILVDNKPIVDDITRSENLITTQLVLKGSSNQNTKVALSYLLPNTSYCAFSGPINYESELVNFYNNVKNQQNSCGTENCDRAYTTYYDTQSETFTYQEYVTYPGFDNPQISISGTKSTGFSNLPFQGLGCRKIAKEDLQDQLLVDYYKYFTVYPFMPGFSYSSGVLGETVGDNIIAGLIISNLSLLFGAYFLYKLVKIDFSEKVAIYSAIFYIVWPFSFLLSAFLTESLFNFVLILSLYLIKTKRDVFGIFLSALLPIIRIIGLLAIFPYIVIFAKNYARDKKLFKFAGLLLLTLLVAPALLIWHSNYLYSLTGDYFAYFNAQKAWDRLDGGLIVSLINYIRYFGVYAYFELIIYFLSAVILVLGYLKNKLGAGTKLPEYTLLAILFMIFPILTGSFQSLPRFTITVFPMYIAAAVLVKDLPKWVSFIILLASFIFSCIFMAVWVLGSNLIV